MFNFGELKRLNLHYLINHHGQIGGINLDTLEKHKWQPQFGKSEFGKFVEIKVENKMLKQRKIELEKQRKRLEDELDNLRAQNGNQANYQNIHDIEEQLKENAELRIELDKLIAEKKGLEENLKQEKTDKTKLENQKNNLQFEVGNLNAQIEQNRQNQAQNNHQNWQKDQQKFIRQNQYLENQKHEAEIRIAQIGLALDEKTTKISQQEKELNREKNHNQIGTKINLGLLKEKNSLNKNLENISQATSQILQKKDWQNHQEKFKLTQKYQQNSRVLTQNLKEKSVGEMILFASLVIVFGLLLTMSFWIILN